MKTIVYSEPNMCNSFYTQLQLNVIRSMAIVFLFLLDIICLIAFFPPPKLCQYYNTHKTAFIGEFWTREKFSVLTETVRMGPLIKNKTKNTDIS